MGNMWTLWVTLHEWLPWGLKRLRRACFGLFRALLVFLSVVDGRQQPGKGRESVVHDAAIREAGRNSVNDRTPA